jgi:hypothetical protein
MLATVLSYACIAILVCNAIFWGLLSHKTHCRVSGALGVTCVRHTYHQATGAVCGALGLILATVLVFRSRK